MNIRALIHRNFRLQPAVRESWLRTLTAIEALPEYKW
jgi:hypothetical protein